MFGLFQSLPSISIDTLEEKLKHPLVLLDVRTPVEYRSGHIAKAQNVPLNEIGRYQPKGKATIYVICQSGARSKRAARILSQKGIDVINIRGGMNQWHGPVRSGK